MSFLKEEGGGREEEERRENGRVGKKEKKEKKDHQWSSCWFLFCGYSPVKATFQGESRQWAIQAASGESCTGTFLIK